MNPQIIKISLSLALSAFAVDALAQESDADTLKRLLSDVSTLRADVQQLILESDGGVLEESSIKMQLKKPDGFYWETLDPFPELVVTNGIKLWNYQPDLEQVVIEDWQSDQSELAAQLLSGRTESLTENYDVSLRQIVDMESNFILTPKAADSVYRSISIRFNDTTLDAINLNAKNGEQTVWQFLNLQSNITLDDQLFVFEPPPGIEVIQNSYAP